MAQNLASLQLTAADMAALNGALATIKTPLGNRAVSRRTKTPEHSAWRSKPLQGEKNT